MDVKSYFLNGVIKRGSLCRTRKVFEDPYFSKNMIRLTRALYGLNKSHHAWYKMLTTFLLNNDFLKGGCEKLLFVSRHYYKIGWVFQCRLGWVQ